MQHQQLKRFSAVETLCAGSGAWQGLLEGLAYVTTCMEARPAIIQMVIKHRYHSPPSHDSYCEILGTSTSPVQRHAARAYGLHIDAYYRRWRRRSQRWTHAGTHRLTHRRSRRRHGTRMTTWKTQIAHAQFSLTRSAGSPPYTRYGWSIPPIKNQVRCHR